MPFDRTELNSFQDDSGGGIDGTIINKARLDDLITDMEKGAFGTQGDAQPYFGFDDANAGVKFGPGGATAPDVLLKRTAAGRLAVRNIADSAYEDLYADNVVVPATKKVELGDQTWITEGSDDVFQIFTGGTKMLELSTGGLTIPANKPLFLDGGVDTLLEEITANQIRIVCGNTERMRINHANYSVMVRDSSGNDSVGLNFTGAGNALALAALERDTGNNGPGRFISLGANTNAITPSPSSVRLEEKDETGQYIWVDSSGILRIDASQPTSIDTGGTVIGTQTSWHERKSILGPALPAEDALRSVADLAFDKFEFRERSFEAWDGSNQVFNGLVVRSRKDWWAMNCGPLQTPALNDIELFARYGLTIQKLIEEVQALGGLQWL